MAKVKAHLLSLGSSGQLGKSVVGMRRKSANVVRQHVVPNNPKTPAQTEARRQWSEANWAWKNKMIASLSEGPTIYRAWNVAAKAARLHAGGYHMYMGIAYYHNLTYANPWIFGLANTSPGYFAFAITQPRSYGGWPEPGTYKLFRGPNPESLSFLKAGVLLDMQQSQLNAWWGLDLGWTYVQMFKDNKPCSGIFHVEIIPP